MATIQDLLDLSKEYDKEPSSSGFSLRLDLADIVMREMTQKNWTQKRLAEAAGMKPSFINRIIHGNANCTFDVAGRILFALGVKASLRETIAGRVSGVASDRIIIGSTGTSYEEVQGRVHFTKIAQTNPAKPLRRA